MPRTRGRLKLIQGIDKDHDGSLSTDTVEQAAEYLVVFVGCTIHGERNFLTQRSGHFRDPAAQHGIDLRGARTYPRSVRQEEYGCVPQTGVHRVEQGALARARRAGDKDEILRVLARGRCGKAVQPF